MTVEKLMAIIGDELEPDLANLQVFVDVDDGNTEFIIDFKQYYELYKDYTVTGYTMLIGDPWKIIYTIHIRQPKPIYLVKSGSREYYTKRENIARTIDRMYIQYGTDIPILISKTDKTI